MSSFAQDYDFVINNVRVIDPESINVADSYAAKGKSGWPPNYGTSVTEGMTQTRVHDPKVNSSGWHDAASEFELCAQSVEKGADATACITSAVDAE